MRFTDNAELTSANMANADILAGTDVSASTDKKFTLSGLADWFLNRFTGLSLAGKNQSVKAAIDELNSTIALTPTVFKNRINILSQVCFKVGDRVYVNIICIANQAFAGNTIITGLPTPSTAQFIPVNVSGAYIQATTSPVTGIIADNIASGTKFVISGIYSAQ